MQQNIYFFKWWLLFIVYVLLYTAINWLTNDLIYTDSYYYTLLGDQFSSDRIEQIIEMTKKFQLIGFGIAPLLLFFKTIIITCVLYACLYIFNQVISFKNCLKIVLLAELVLILSALTKLVCFFVHKPETIKDIQFFYPLAITNFLTMKQVPSYLVYPLQQFNLFEIAYWILLAMGIKAFTSQSFKQSFKLTAFSYGFALCLWILVVVFIQLQFS